MNAATTNECPACSGQLVILGQQGHLLHKQCRACGLRIDSPARDQERYARRLLQSRTRGHNRRL